jgi:hypothetical protein
MKRSTNFIFIAALLFFFLIGNYGCTGIVFYPQSLTVTPGMAANFMVGTSGTQNWSYQWNKDGVPIPGATSSVYYIASAQETDAGAYTVTVSNTDETITSNIVTLVVSPIVSGPAHELVPSVVSPGSGIPMQIVFDGWDDTTAVELEMRDGSIRPLNNVPNSNKWWIALTQAEVLDGYVLPEGNGHFALNDLLNFIGELRTKDSIHPYSIQLFAPVLVPGIPSVTPSMVGGNIQESPHIVNIRYDDLYSSVDAIKNVHQTFFQHYYDDYDFIIQNWLARDANIYSKYGTIRNNVYGIGRDILNWTVEFGVENTQKLKGHIYLNPGGSSIDLAGQVLSHEIGHAFMNYIQDTPLSANKPHFPVSTTALGIMGTSSPNTNITLTKISSSEYLVVPRSPYGGFNEFELYMMGLMPSTGVQAQIVFNDQTVKLDLGNVLAGPVTTVTIDEVIEANGGERDPSYPDAQNAFRAATIIISRGRLLSEDEMTYLDYMAARGELQVPIDDTYGRPFYVSTAGRATLSTSIHEE